MLQHSYSKAPVKLEPKFGQIILKTKPTYYNTATPILLLEDGEREVTDQGEEEDLVGSRADLGLHAPLCHHTEC